MSPTAFKLHVTHLTSVFKRCDELCDAILAHRRTGKKHESLDSLQLGLKASTQAIQSEYTSLRKVFGSRFDLGDNIARESLKSSIRATEEIERRLTDIANRRNDGLPGFRDMSRTIERIEDGVADHLVALGQRLETPVKLAERKPEKKQEKKPEKKEEKKEEKKSKKTDEIVISIKEWDRYVEHLKNSWSESLVSGRILYVNAFDESRNTWDLPRGGFIKTLPIPVPKPTTRPFEERRPRETSPLRRPRETSPLRRTSTRDDRRSSRRFEDDREWARGTGW